MSSPTFVLHSSLVVQLHQHIFLQKARTSVITLPITVLDPPAQDSILGDARFLLRRTKSAQWTREAREEEVLISP